LHQAGLGITEIAQQRGLSPSTIASHLADMVARGDIEDVSRWVDEVTLRRIRLLADGQPVGALGPLKEALGDAVTYEQLHIARAAINRERSR
jgi:ATP-dependent DNA helicase RecQ